MVQTRGDTVRALKANCKHRQFDFLIVVAIPGAASCCRSTSACSSQCQGSGSLANMQNDSLCKRDLLRTVLCQPPR